MSAAQTAGARPGLGFGTAPVFLASISTILGAIMFLRFGYAVAHTGLMGSLLIILIGHLVTLPTALAIAEIATNRKVEGGGEYFIISRSFGPTIGASIGILLYLSQALSVSFYMIAFAESFQPLAPWFTKLIGMPFDARMISIPATIFLVTLVLFRGADMGVKALWVVCCVLGVSIVAFFMGNRMPGVDPAAVGLYRTVESPHTFFVVFAIVFPAFTGMTAGVGLSGDLAKPRKSIPLGILSATVAGMIVYVAIVIKLAYSATPEDLAADQLIMSRIAIWGPIIPIGLACATLSSAIGSILVAPRTMQALAADRSLVIEGLNNFLSRGTSETNEPRPATVVTGALAVAVVSAGSIDFVARIISMFFMMTYGAICAISFLEHFAARPSYRPSFRSKWYLSLVGASMCFLLMFQMDPVYALLAIVVMAVLYKVIAANRKGRPDDLAEIFRGVMTQSTRHLQIKLQKSLSGRPGRDWRPSIIMVNSRTFDRSSPLQMLAWLCHRYGFGTYLHFIQGQLSSDTFRESRKVLLRLIKTMQVREQGIYVDTLISPSMRSALAQSLQVPGVSGMENNTILFESSVHDDEAARKEMVEGCLWAYTVRMNTLVLRHGDTFFGHRKNIHLWLTWHDYDNASLMVLLSYILLGHPDWEDAEISIYAGFPHGDVAEQTRKLKEMISSGRIPVTEQNIRIIPTDEQVDFDKLVETRSKSADLVILGFTEDRLREKGVEIFTRHPSLNEVLFVSAQERIKIE